MGVGGGRLPGQQPHHGDSSESCCCFLLLLPCHLSPPPPNFQWHCNAFARYRQFLQEVVKVSEKDGKEKSDKGTKSGFIKAGM